MVIPFFPIETLLIRHSELVSESAITWQTLKHPDSCRDQGDILQKM